MIFVCPDNEKSNGGFGYEENEGRNDGVELQEGSGQGVG